MGFTAWPKGGGDPQGRGQALPPRLSLSCRGLGLSEMWLQSQRLLLQLLMLVGFV